MVQDRPGSSEQRVVDPGRVEAALMQAEGPLHEGGAEESQQVAVDVAQERCVGGQRPSAFAGAGSV
ncbi:hypothetical protein ACFRU3_48240 [Streptomyces sp. NPDC056910]|uniref:hypothetical protein n=1 Tax=Streptomyces sp. NPDC056910 TaxID=3345964 RepID=UPI0036B865B9